MRWGPGSSSYTNLQCCGSGSVSFRPPGSMKQIRIRIRVAKNLPISWTIHQKVNQNHKEKNTHFCLAHLNNMFINSKTNFFVGHIFFSRSDPDPLFTETDPGIRIRIKMKRICNTANCYSFSEVKYEALKGLFTGFSKFHGKFLWV